MNQQIDYRNGKYQGETNSSGQRDGLGIFIDDDLTFYISHWSQNKMNGLSLIYISHGKYIYGEWKNNEPHGLVVFRSGETVIVGRFNRGKPVKRSLVIFQRFNFACIMDEDDGDWRITDSGQLINHDTLMKYIRLIGVPVPEHYFSLTKFACHFAKYSNSVKAFPCLSNSCYFGYNDGLAIVFNSNNALISIGAHCNESLRQFGGKFDGLRSAQQGNFEKGGEVVRYSGERPSTKIYSIFQRIHKKSLIFKNQYFDSRLKIFTNIQNLLKSKLQQITTQCKKNKSMRNVDLNQSLSYQEYTEQESFKINQIRDTLYGHSGKNTPTEKQFTPKKTKNVEEHDDFPVKYFKKTKVKELEESPDYQKKEEEKIKSKILKSTTPKRQSAETIPQNYLQKRKSSLQRPQQFTLDNKKSLYSQSIHKREEIKQIQYNQPTTPSKQKEKMRSNNLRYINSNITQAQNIQEKTKSPIVTKSNNIYKQISQQARKHQQQQQKKIQSLKSQENENFKVPNFKYLIEQAEKSKITKTVSNYQPQKSTLVKKDNLNDRQINGSVRQSTFSYKNPNNEMYRQVSQPQPPSEQSNEKLKKPSYQLTPKKQAKKSIDFSNLQKPNYEDIEERRKRILREYKDLNSKGNTINNQMSNNKNEPKAPQARPQSPYNKIMFSLSKQEQSSFGFLPISISQKASNTKNTQNNIAKKIDQTNERVALNEKVSNFYDYPSKMDSQYFKKYQKESQNQKSMPIYPSSAAKPTSYHEKDYRQSKTVTNSNQKPGSTPKRTKKNYQYLYE